MRVISKCCTCFYKETSFCDKCTQYDNYLKAPGFTCYKCPDKSDCSFSTIMISDIIELDKRG